MFGDKPVKVNGFVPAETMDPGVYFTNQFVEPPVVQLKSTLLLVTFEATRFDGFGQFGFS